MAIQYKESNIHWNFYLALQKDFEILSRYIEFSEQNNDTFSIELARIIMSASQEVDVIMKNLCSIFSGTSPTNINEYRKVIKKHLPDLIEENIYIARFGMSGKPWIKWQGDSNPTWWQANNKIKHQRNDYFHEANLKNAFNALGALLIVNLYFLKLKSGKSWTDTTEMINSGNDFIKLNNKYYAQHLILE